MCGEQCCWRSGCNSGVKSWQLHQAAAGTSQVCHPQTGRHRPRWWQRAGEGRGLGSRARRRCPQWWCARGLVAGRGWGYWAGTPTHKHASLCSSCGGSPGNAWCPVLLPCWRCQGCMGWLRAMHAHTWALARGAVSVCPHHTHLPKANIWCGGCPHEPMHARRALATSRHGRRLDAPCVSQTEHVCAAGYIATVRMGRLGLCVAALLKHMPTVGDDWLIPHAILLAVSGAHASHVRRRGALTAGWGPWAASLAAGRHLVWYWCWH